MAEYSMPEQMRSLPEDQQHAIKAVMVKVGLLNEAGEPISEFEDLPEQSRQALEANLNSFGIQVDRSLFGLSWKCAAARAGEAAAVIACASVPGGQLAIAACIALAHEVANQACK